MRGLFSGAAPLFAALFLLVPDTLVYAKPNDDCHDADLILRNAKIVTMDPARYVASSLAIRNQRILATGSDADIAACAGPRTQTLDLQGHSVLPGLIDVHTHAMEWAKDLLRNDVDPGYPKVHSIAEIVKAIGEQAASAPKGKWIRGAGWDESKLAEHRYITRKDLDAVAPNTPVWLEHFTGHLGVANTRALELAHLTPDPPDLALKAVRLVTQRALEVGLTTIHDICLPADAMRAYQQARQEGWLKLRVQMAPLVSSVMEARAQAAGGVYTGFGDDYLKLGAVKMFADGGMAAKTIAVYEPAAGEPGNLGLLIWKPEDMQKAQHVLAAAGWQLETHAIGDRAMDEVLDSYQSVMKDLGLKEPRFRIVHAGLSTPAIQKRLRDLRVL